MNLSGTDKSGWECLCLAGHGRESLCKAEGLEARG